MAENYSIKSSTEDSLLKHIDISVLESEKRTNGTLNLRDYYMVYLLEVRVTDPKFCNELTNLSMVWRRYTEFEQLYNYLKHQIAKPDGPKTYSEAFKQIDPEKFIELTKGKRLTGQVNTSINFNGARNLFNFFCIVCLSKYCKLL